MEIKNRNLKLKMENENENQISKLKMKIKNRILISITYFMFFIACLGVAMVDSNGIFWILSYILLTIGSAWCILFILANKSYFERR